MGFINDGLRYILNAINMVVPSYAWTIVLFTLAVRMLLLPLDIKSKRSMKRMSDVQPKINALNKKYANDKEKLNQKMAELYKKEKINPMAGCLPMLIQLPILFAMFAVLRTLADEQTVKMLMDMMNGKEPAMQSFFWIKNIFQPDSFMSTIIPGASETLAMITADANHAILNQANLDAVRAFIQSPEYAEWLAKFGADQMQFSAPMLMWTINIPAQFNGWFLLPVLAAVTQFLSTKLMPQTAAPATGADGKPAQNSNQFMMYFFPLFSLWICSTYNAAFSLYWVAANVIQIIQTFALNKWFEYQDKKAAPAVEEDK